MAKKYERLVAVIMAGGSGTRFWPLSREARPKQFLPIAGEKTMLEETIDRLLPLIPPEDIYTISSEAYVRIIRKLVPFLPAQNCLVEPLARNTAPSLLLATAKLFLEEPQTVVAALPSDHVILQPEVFRRKLEAAASAANEGYLVTFGIRPTYPATGYGYINFDSSSPLEFKGESFYSVLSFKEKPTREQAEKFLKAGNYYWNSGMFLWRADFFPEKLKAYAPDWFPFWEKIIEALAQKKDDELIGLFKQMPVLSIDYALMEKAKEVVVCPGDFDWSDVGLWSSLLDLWPKDERNNTCRGEVISLQASGNLVYNPKKLTALIEVNDLIVVNTDDVLLICHRQADQRIRELIDWLKGKEKKEYL
ncbi:MAG: mannose-1-phosphate guanylyltransferase [Candidatus Aminicenantes bacterium]|nr:mannose-1-phosphate guanylyltransferase [Candidatus Aminicenantes bacterium]